jgi:hypothetical protein
MKKIYAILVVAIVTMVSGINSNAQENKESKWVEIQEVEIPFGLDIQEGLTKKGNPKYWFTFEEIGNVTISEGNVKHYTNQTKTIVLVKWEKSGKYKYTTRQKKGEAKKVTPNVDVNKIFNK